MKKSTFCVLSAAAVIGAALTSTAASAEVAAPGPTANTQVTFTVTSGFLTITAPATVDLGAAAPGGTVSGVMADTVVTDDRALLTAAWIATASETNFTTGGDTPAETIPAADATYDPGAITTTGTITATGTNITLGNGAAPIVNGTNGQGNNTGTWDATITGTIPANAVGGNYTGILTQSVS